MQEYELLPHSRMFDLYSALNRENIPDCKAVSIREIDISSLERVRKNLQQGTQKPTYTAFVAKATSIVLREMPHANRAAIKTFFLSRILRFAKAHVSVAVERNDAEANAGGAFVYTIYNTEMKSLNAITGEIAGLAQSSLTDNDSRLDRWRRMTFGLRRAPFFWMVRCVLWGHKNIPSLYIKNRGGAAMISSPSKYGVDFIVAHWPYTLGISFGFAKERPWVEAGQLVVRKTMPMTLAFDRRLISGADAARFMNRLCEILENAEKYLNS